MADLTLDGLASGMPTQDIISQLMAVERRPIIYLQEDKNELTKAKDAWRDINSRLDKLGTKITDLKLSSTFDSNKATSSDENIVTATAATSASAGSYDLNITKLAQNHRVASNQQSDSTTDLNLGASDTGGSFDITINGTTMTVNVTGDDTLNNVQDAINNDTENDDGSGNQLVKASIVDNTLVIESAETGATNTLSFTDGAEGVLQELGVVDGSNAVQNELQAAQDAAFSVNGLNVTRSSNEDIDDVIEGVTFNLKDTGIATVDVSRDIEKTTSAIQEFVDQYNSVQDFINTKSDYNSSTETGGALQGDGTLMRLQSKLRRYVTDSVDTTSTYDQLAMVGISVDEEGIMTFDSSKFEKAMNDDPSAVKKLFNSDTSDGDSFDGIAIRLDSYIDVLVQSDGIIPEKVDSYDNMINNVEEDIESLEDRLEMRKETLLEEFTAMEKALSEMNNQSSWMMSQLNSMGSMTGGLLNSMM